jgi:O-antigen ligase
MQPSIFILVVIAILLVLFVPLITRGRPVVALTLWIIAGIVLDGYSYPVGNPPSYLRVSHLLLFGILVAFAMRRGRLARIGKVELLISGLIVWAVISSCIGGTIFRGDTLRNIGVLINGFAIPVLLLYLARSVARPKASRAACGVLTVLLGYLVFTAFCEHFSITNLIFPQYILDPTMGLHADRARGPVINAAEDGGIIAVLLIVALHRTRYAFNRVVRGLGPIALLATGTLALWFTQTRGPWVAFAVGLAILLLHDPRRRVISAIAILMLIALPVSALLGVTVVPQRDETTVFRLDLYRESLAAFKERPIAGWGLGTFTSQYHLFAGFGPGSSLAGNIQHDTTVAIATENGAIGAALYLSFMAYIVRSLLRRRKIETDPESRDFAVMCVAVLATFFVNGSFADCRFWMPQNSLVFFLAGLGLASGYERSRKPAFDVTTARLESNGVQHVHRQTLPGCTLSMESAPRVGSHPGMSNWKREEEAAL